MGVNIAEDKWHEDIRFFDAHEFEGDLGTLANFRGIM